MRALFIVHHSPAHPVRQPGIFVFIVRFQFFTLLHEESLLLSGIESCLSGALFWHSALLQGMKESWVVPLSGTQ
jgi:hypothetical protein